MSIVLKHGHVGIDMFEIANDTIVTVSLEAAKVPSTSLEVVVHSREGYPIRFELDIAKLLADATMSSDSRAAARRVALDEVAAAKANLRQNIVVDDTVSEPDPDIEGPENITLTEGYAPVNLDGEDIEIREPATPKKARKSKKKT